MSNLEWKAATSTELGRIAALRSLRLTEFAAALADREATRSVTYHVSTMAAYILNTGVLTLRFESNMDVLDGRKRKVANASVTHELQLDLPTEYTPKDDEINTYVGSELRFIVHPYIREALANSMQRLGVAFTPLPLMKPAGEDDEYKILPVNDKVERDPSKKGTTRRKKAPVKPRDGEI